MATGRRPGNGPMQRQRIWEKSLWSYGCPTFGSGCCAFAAVENTTRRIVAKIIPVMNPFPATPIRIRVLREKGEDTLAAGAEQCVASFQAELTSGMMAGVRVE